VVDITWIWKSCVPNGPKWVWVGWGTEGQGNMEHNTIQRDQGVIPTSYVTDTFSTMSVKTYYCLDLPNFIVSLLCFSNRPGLRSFLANFIKAWLSWCFHGVPAFSNNIKKSPSLFSTQNTFPVGNWFRGWRELIQCLNCLARLSAHVFLATRQSHRAISSNLKPLTAETKDLYMDEPLELNFLFNMM
jgi:hypothetical protein